ncbi:sensor histidine kinase [Rhodovibrionaceae bacterium A322]
MVKKTVTLSRRLSFKQALYAIVAAAVLGGVMGVAFFIRDLNSDRENTQHLVSQYFEASIDAATQAAYEVNVVSAQAVLEGLMAHEIVARAQISTDFGDILAEEQKPVETNLTDRLSRTLFSGLKDHSRELIFVRPNPTGEAPSPEAGFVVGELKLEISLEMVGREFISRYLTTAGSRVLEFCFLGALLTWVFNYTLTKPVMDIERGLSAVDPTQPAATKLPPTLESRDDELGAVAKETNKLLDRMQSLIEAHAQAQQQLEFALRNAERANTAKGQFLATMSHELRTPLNAMIGFAQITEQELFGPVGNDRYRDYAIEIVKSGELLLGIINDILELARIENGTLQIEKELIELPDICQEASRYLERRINEKSIDFSLELVENCPQVEGDSRRLKQVIINLIDNASKFTPENGRIQVTAHPDGVGFVRISVSDSGIGIPKEKLATVLRPFEQVETAFARSHGGAGLGLAIATQIIEAHGGKLEIDSALGEGTVVAILLPSV